MSKSDSIFAGSIPAIYDRFMGPMFFEPYAADLAERLRKLNPELLLEIASGTGIVTRVLRRSLPESVSIIASDLNQPMLDFAAAHPGAERITWQQADALHLPFPDGRFDAVICQFGVMFFPDKAAAYREARRVLKPDGHFIFNVWDRIEENEIAFAVEEALAAFIPGNPPRFMSRVPHGYHDFESIQQELRTAGFKRIEMETKQLESRAASARDAATGICQGTPLRNEIEERIPGRLAEATDFAGNRLASHFGNGSIAAKMQAGIFTAIK
jgi:ubiquinone/menaquinone biosynthesis C-methylase UbiE